MSQPDRGASGATRRRPLERWIVCDEPQELERVHVDEALRLLGRAVRPFEPFTDLLASPSCA